jgi:integrase
MNTIQQSKNGVLNEMSKPPPPDVFLNLVESPAFGMPDSEISNLCILPEQITSNPYIKAATSPNTRRAYQSDIRHFEKWGGPLPAGPEHLVQYLLHFAQSLNARTLSRRLVALGNWHVYQGFPDPSGHSAVVKTMAGIVRTHGRPKDKSSALSAEDLVRIVSNLEQDSSMRSARDIALLLVGFFGAFRRSELVAIQVAHLTWKDDGLEILIPHSKTDQENEGQVCAVPAGTPPLCPVHALRKWLDISGIHDGFLFRAARKKNIDDQPLTAGMVSLILKKHAREAGIRQQKKLSSHSLRRGLASRASAEGASIAAIMRQGRWKNVNTVMEYIEAAQRFEDNAASQVMKGIGLEQKSGDSHETVFSRQSVPD